MANYEVTAEKYTGKHRVYKKGDVIPESELIGNKKVLIGGQKGAKNKRGQMLPEVKPAVKETSAKPGTKKAGK